MSLCVKIGLVTLDILPKKTKEIKAKKLDLKSKSTTAVIQKAPKKKKRFDKVKVRYIIKMCLKSLACFRKKLSIDYLRIHYTFASNNPAKTAIGFGIASTSAALSFSLLESAFDIKESEFEINSDFQFDKPTLDIWLNLRIMFWEIIYIAAALCIDYLKYLLRTKSINHKKERNK